MIADTSAASRAGDPAFALVEAVGVTGITPRPGIHVGPFAVRTLCLEKRGPTPRFHDIPGDGGNSVSVVDVARPDRVCAAPCRRADASRNHERILSAARAVFVEDGAEASLDQVARRAGVGNATLYRHFGDREDLIRQVATHVIAQVADDAESALAEQGDPF